MYLNHKKPSLQTLLNDTYLEIRRLYFVSQFPIIESIPNAYFCGLVNKLMNFL